MPVSNVYTVDQAKQNYDVKVTIFKDNTVQFKVYESDITKVKSGYDPLAEDDQSSDNQSITELLPEVKLSKSEVESLKEIRSDSLSRSRNLLIDLAHQNYDIWRSFITLTFAENITDVTEANKKFNNWSKCILRKKPDFKYLCVPEFQKRGAVHYHLITNLECGSDLLPARKPKQTKSDKGKYHTLIYYDLPFWVDKEGKSYGFSSAFDLRLTNDKFNVALYITKYLYKDIDNRLYGRRKIMHSMDLDRPEYRETRLKNLSYFIRNSNLINFYEFKASKPFQKNFQMFEFNLDEYEIDLLRKNLMHEFEL